MPQERKGNYGQDSPAIVATLCVMGLVGVGAGVWVTSAWRWAGFVLGAYFLLGAGGMLFYSKRGKLGLRDRLLDKIPWRGDERVIDVGCGRGLLTIGAAHRLPNGKVFGVDIWNPRALTGNQSVSVLENAKIEGVNDKVEAKEGDARKLPFADESFDAVVSNFVLHELQKREDREQMSREMARVLKPGGKVGLVDFIFTDECVDDLRKFGVEARRERDDDAVSFWVSAILNFGLVKTYFVVGTKAQKPSES